LQKKKKKIDARETEEQLPIFEFKMTSGPPLYSKSSWAIVKMRGSGPGKRAIQSKGILNAILEKWHKFYLSLYADGLYFYENKQTLDPIYVVPIADIKGLRIEAGVHTGFGGGKGFINEDLFNVIVDCAYDIIWFRFLDGASRINWIEAFQNVVDRNEKTASDAGVPQRRP
jgi:hypothetical protein